ncbi:aldo/keto reductase [Salinicola rhizosphaerae]|uniref:Oxidoreductase n=1 Tax=Salinicola rhizosphaerae TaxID=1443141 RepID=A0ABQ3DTZ7_9GAMM|nr:aldo/keto reductase [Salinicola rhizosphaerae]GHB16423.1 oxidoreductase [Salinicola rhizosphaerae]
MQMRSLGHPDIQTAPIVFGGNVFGWTLDDKQSFAMIDAWLDAGFNAIDTADVYSRWAEGNQGGESETVLGKWFKQSGRRDEVVLTSKVGMDLGDGKVGLSKAYIMQAIEASLTRLQTDYLDVYFSHQDDQDTPLEETLEAYDRLIEQGKIRMIAASNYTGDRLSKALEVSKAKSLPAYRCLQPFYNLYDREDFERDLAPVCREHDIAVVPYFSLASGFLTGKYRSREDAKGQARADFVDKYFDDKGMRILEALDSVSKRYDTQPAAVSLAWLLAQPTVTAPIASASKPHHLDALKAACDLKLDADALKTLDDASRG